MALYSKERAITTILKGKRNIAVVYKGAQLVWQYIRSCFGRGYWINEKPWQNDNGWKN